MERMSGKQYKNLKQFLEENSSVIVNSKGKKYYYMPYWFHEIDDTGNFNIYHLDNLPEELKRLINQIREKNEK